MLMLIKTYKKTSALLLIALSIPIALLHAMAQPTLFSHKFTQSKITQLNNIPLANATNLQQHVKFLSELDRTTASEQQKTVDYLVNNLKNNGISETAIEIQEYKVNNDIYQNVAVHFPAKEIGAPNYIIGSHYDSFSLAEQTMPGADDNASGVAGLLELARMLQATTITDRSISLVFYSTEEPPFFNTKNMGSYHHAESIATNIDNIKKTELVIILEMIGYFSEKENSQHYPVSIMKYLYPTTGNFISIVSDMDNSSQTKAVKKRFQSVLSNKNLITVASINAPASIKGIDFSDHRNYWLFDIPAVMITDTSFFRNTNYHTTEDTYEKLNYQKMKEVIDATLITVLSL